MSAPATLHYKDALNLPDAPRNRNERSICWGGGAISHAGPDDGLPGSHSCYWLFLSCQKITVKQAHQHHSHHKRHKTP